MNITQKNKIIAEFMGISHQKMAMNFNSNWSLLMDAVDKIYKTSFFVLIKISPNKTSISVFDIEGQNHFATCPKVNTLECKMIDATYKAVFNFIEWYNQQKTKSC